MKRKCIILVSIFIFFLVLGIWLNGQKGMNLMADFWTLEKDGSLTHQNNRLVMEMIGGVIVICMAIVTMFLPLAG